MPKTSKKNDYQHQKYKKVQKLYIKVFKYKNIFSRYNISQF
jgi:hypothetical protein